MLKLGSKVDVSVILMATPNFEPNIYSWVSGYILVGIIDRIYVVQRIGGVFDGCLYNHKPENVRMQCQLKHH